MPLRIHFQTVVALRGLAALAAKEGMTLDELLGRLIAFWRTAKR